MITYSVAALLLAYFGTVHTQATICLATYGGVATSVPPPGRDFIVQVSPYLSPVYPGNPGSGYLDSTGQVQSLCQKSSTFVLSNGFLYSGSEQVSVALGVPFMRFEASEYAETIDSIFAVNEAEGKMVWNNNAFQDGTARFCADPTGALFAVFLGPLPGNCTLTELSVESPDSCQSLLRPLQVLPTLFGNQTSLSIPTASASVPTRQPYPHLQPQPLLQPLLQPPSIGSNLNISSNTSSIIYSPLVAAPSSSTILIFSLNSTTTSSSSSIPSTSSSTPSSSVTSVGSFVAFTTLTLGSASTASVSSSGDPVSQASAIIRQNRFTVWCTQILGYTVPTQITTTIMSNISATSIITSRPINDTTTITKTLTSTATRGIPSFAITITTIPIVTDTVTSIDEVVVEKTTTVVGPSLGAKKRGLPYMPGKPLGYGEEQPRLAYPSYDAGSGGSNITSASSGTLPASIHVISGNSYTKSASNHTVGISSFGTAVRSNSTAGLNATAIINATSAISNATGLRTITTPVILQTFNPSVINAACSQNAAPPTALPNITTSITTTFIYTSYITQPYTTVNTTYIIPVNTTINNGNFSVTLTATPVTNGITDMTTETTTITTSVVTFPSNVPALILTSAVPIGPFNAGGAPPPDLDDATFEVTLPFQMRMFDHSSESVWVSSNGILSLDNGTREYDNECLPSIGNYDYPHDPVPPYSAFPFWDDTYIYAGQPQGIYYQYGNGPQANLTAPASSGNTQTGATNVTFEYYLSHCCGNGDGGNEKYYHYTVFYDSDDPGVFTYRYYQISQNGNSSTVGMQDYLANTAITYSCNQAKIWPGLEVVLNSIIGTVQHRNFTLPS